MNEPREFLVEAKKNTYFNGIETVSKDGHKIYELHCTGGRII